MASFSNALRTYSNGSLSLDELLQVVDQVLDNGRANARWMLTTLTEENTKTPLPDDVHNVVRQRIESAYIEQEYVESQSKPGIVGSRLGVARSISSKSEQHEPVYRYGDTLKDRFELVECLGQGGMSTVYKALDRRKLEAHDREPYVAVKVLSMEFRRHPDSLVALQREAKKCQTLSHPNIVRVYDFDRDGDTVFMTMECLSGKSLASKMRSGELDKCSTREKLRIIREMGEALAFAHGRNIVHSDFTPANVFVTDANEVKVIDFGIARACQGNDQEKNLSATFDAGALRALTPSYASPEMMEMQSPDPRDDIYGFACTVYEVLTGEHPFDRNAANVARDQRLKVKRRKGLSKRQWKALKRALVFQRKRRTPSVKAFFKRFDTNYKKTLLWLVFLFMLAGMLHLFINSKLFPLLWQSEIVKQIENELAIRMPAFYDVRSKYSVQEPASPTKDQGLVQDSPNEQASNASKTPSAASSADAEKHNGAVSNESMLGVPEKEINGVPEQRQEGVRQSISGATDLDTVITADGDGTEQSFLDQQQQKITADTTISAHDVQVKINHLVEHAPCSAMRTRIDGNTLYIHGIAHVKHVRKIDQQIDKLQARHRVENRLVALPNKSQCDVVELLSTYLQVDRYGRRSVTLSPNLGKRVYAEGENIEVKIVTPVRKSYIYIDYFTSAGAVLHMAPSNRVSLHQAPAFYRVTLGRRGEWRAAQPFGYQLMTIISTPEPLQLDDRKEYESKFWYLPSLSRHLDEMKKKYGKDKIATDFLLIQTKPKH